MELKEIFIKNPELIENEEVKALIEYVDEQHHKNLKFVRKQERKLNRILEACMYSEVILIGGKSSKAVIEEIMEII